MVTHPIDRRVSPTSSHRRSRDQVAICVFCVHLLISATKIAITDVHPTVMAGHVPATSRDRLSLRMAGTCSDMTVEHAAGIFIYGGARARWRTVAILAFPPTASNFASVALKS